MMRFPSLTAWVLGLGMSAALAQPLVVPGPQLQADGIPGFQRRATPVRAESTAAMRLLGWHPLRAEMLVLRSAGPSRQLHRLAQAGAKPEQLSSGRDPVESARWEPERAEYLVLRRDNGGDEAWRLYRLDAGPATQPVPISPADARVSDYQFLPGGQGLVYVLDKLDREGERKPLSRLVWVQPSEPAGTRVIAELPGGRFGSLQVSAGGRVTVLQTVGKRSQLMQYALDGTARALDAPQPVEGKEPETPDDEEEIRWSSQALRSDYRHLMGTELGSGRRKPFLPQREADIEALAENRSPGLKGTLALAYNEQGVSRLYTFQPKDELLTPVAQQLPAGVVSRLSWHPRLPLLAFEHVSGNQAGRIWVLDFTRRDQPELRAWTGSDAKEGMAAIDYSTLQWKSFDGLAISALHVAPPARFSGPRPVFISLHGGPSGQSRPGYLAGTSRQLVESLGMHLILPNVRGSTGFGKRFTDLDNGRKREDATQDVSALLDYIATRPDMDASKVIVAGGSYGGYLSLAVAAQASARIAGSICRVGIANFVSFLENTESYRRDNRRAEYGDERDPAMRAFLTGISPLSRAAQIKKPLFVVHGRNDPRVPYSEAQAMVAAVRAQGTPVWFLSAEDEGHSFTKADNTDYLNQATLEFVHRVLRGTALLQQAP